MTATGHARSAEPTPQAPARCRSRSLRPTQGDVAAVVRSRRACRSPTCSACTAFVWCLPGVVFGARILSDRTVRFPRTSSLPLIGVPRVDHPARRSVIGIGQRATCLFAYRWLLFAGALTSLVWLVNVSQGAWCRRSRSSTGSPPCGSCSSSSGFLGVAAARTFVQRSPFQMALGSLGRQSASSTRSPAGASPRPRASSATRWRAPPHRSTPPTGGARRSASSPRSSCSRGSCSPTASGGAAATCIAARSPSIPMLMSVNRGLWISLGRRHSSTSPPARRCAGKLRAVRGARRARCS
jgi:hypothetical protein